MKTSKYVTLIIIVASIFWFGLFLDRFLLLQDLNLLINFVAKLVYIPHLVTVLLAFKIYKNARDNNKKILLWFTITNIALLLNDISWYFVIYFHFDAINVSLIPFLLNLILFLIWVIAIIIFSHKILGQYVLEIKPRVKTLIVFGLTNIAIILLFLSAIHYASEIFSLETVSQISTFIVQLIVFDFVIMCLIHTESKGLSLFLSGIIVLISGDFFIIYSVVSQTSILYAYGELLWFLGLLLNMFGTIIIHDKANYNIRDWVRKDSAIKSNLAFWCFSIGIISFLLFFVTAFIFSAISRDVFLGLPLFIMIYSVVVVTFASYMGQYFEAPFKQITGNIKVLMLGDKKSNINNAFSIKEFIFLQKFIQQTFKYRDQKNQAKLNEITAQQETAYLKYENETNKAKFLQFQNETHQSALKEQERFKTAIGQMLHDIKSPLSSLDAIVKEESGTLKENARITLRNATNRIGDIAYDMMRKYENNSVTTTNSEVMLVSLALSQIISQKRFEYHNNTTLVFEDDFEDCAYFSFIKINPMNFQRMISNIINNAVEAITGEKRESGLVTIRLNHIENEVIISISDNGQGMPTHIRDKFYAGIAVTEGKETGHGIGLMQVRDVLNNYNGKCDIKIREGRGTKLIIRFPIVETPNWIATKINLNYDDIIVVVDDDESMHGGWNSVFESTLAQFPNLQIKHYYDGQEAIKYLTGLDSEEKEKILLLTDYELLNQSLNGLDIIKITSITRAILVTSYASNTDVQEIVLKSEIKTLPKELTSIVPLIVSRNILKHSRKVDMVWVEDQKTFVDDMVRQYYNHIMVDVYYDPDSFMANVTQYPLDTRFILDTNYYGQNGEVYMDNGFTLAKKLYDMGYTKLILFAGDIIPKDKIPKYLVVIYKNDLENRKILNLV